MSSCMIKINIGGMGYKYPLGVCTLNNSGHLSCTSLCCKSGMAPEIINCVEQLYLLINLFTISSNIAKFLYLIMLIK